MQDLAHLLKPDPVTVMCPTSQAGGHVPRSNEHAMTAPGSVPAADQYSFEVVQVPAEPPKVTASTPAASRSTVTGRSGNR